MEGGVRVGGVVCWRFELQVLTLACRRCWEEGVVRDVMGGETLMCGNE